MRETLQQRCNLFIQNRDAIKAAFKWENTYIYPLCASIYSSRGIKVNADKMKACKGLLKDKTGVFSNFGGTGKMAAVTKLSLAANPEGQMDRMLSVYKDLKEVFWGSEFLAVTAAIITEMAEPGQYKRITKRTRTIYEHMKKAHPFLTGSEDSAFAALLAMSELDDIHITEDMERCYKILAPSFFSKDAVQSLSHVLALGEDSPEHKCQKVMELFDYLKAQGHKYGTNYELSTLGVLAMMEVDVQTLAGDIMAVDDFLEGQIGFGAFGIGAKQRRMYAGMLTMCDYMPDAQTIQAAALSGVVSLVVAQQAALCASLAAASAASSSNASN